PHGVVVDLSEAGERVLIRVRDQGLGIPAAEQKEIFQKFVRGAASKTASIRGTGVGLAMARQIVLAHGGDISVESELGQGSVFTVRLPVHEAVTAVVANRYTTMTKILIVEDEPGIAIGLEEDLTLEGYS